MAWLEGSAERDFEIDAPLDEVAEFFAHPDQFRDCVEDLEDLEQVDDQRWRFTLEELSAKGVSFQGVYTVEYHRDGPVVSWEPAGEDENMKSEGRAELESTEQGGTRVQYRQKMSVELPIPGLMTKVFNPIVSREVRKGVESLLDCAKQTLEAGGAA